jgi:DNA (cytosine-5)-methyltransferase 1
MRVISLFSGAGGMDLGFSQAGHELIWANDLWDDAVKTYRLNLGMRIICADIANVDASAIPDGDIVVGGFPCQGFSVANTKRSAGDVRNFMYLEFRRIVKAKRPRFFVAENVKGILSLEGGRAFEQILSDFAEIGYSVNHAVLNAADYGVPQRRERVLFVGRREDEPTKVDFPPAKTHAPEEIFRLAGLHKWVSIGEALKDVPSPDGPHELQNHHYTKYKLRFNGYLGHRRINPDQPSPTITARGDDRGGVVIHHHPSNERRLSARETALLQSFPLDYKFYGTKTSIYRQVANAVPPLLARRLAEIFPAKSLEAVTEGLEVAAHHCYTPAHDSAAKAI